MTDRNYGHVIATLESEVDMLQYRLDEFNDRIWELEQALSVTTEIAQKALALATPKPPLPSICKHCFWATTQVPSCAHENGPAIELESKPPEDCPLREEGYEEL